MDFLLFLAAEVAGLVPPAMRPAAQLKYSDYPQAALAEGKQGAVIFSVLIDPKGKVVKCTIEHVVETDFGDIICRKLSRGGFEPAKDRTGVPVHGFFRNTNSFWLPDVRGKVSYPLHLQKDLTLNFEPAPGQLTKAVESAVAVLINEDGLISDCSAIGEKSENRQLADIACAQLKASWQASPKTSPDGARLAYVRSITVEFLPK